MTSRLVPDATALDPGTLPFTKLQLYRDDGHPHVAAAYEALSKHAPYTPFQRLSWYDCWQTHVGNKRGLEPLTVIGWQDDRPCLILPLSLKRGRLGTKLIWRADDFCDYCGPMVDPSLAGRFDHGMLKAVLALVAGACGGVSAVRLIKQPQRLGDFHNGHIGSDAIPYHVHAHATRLSPDFDTFARIKRSGKTLRKIRARLTDLGEKGKLEISLAKSRPEAIRLVAQCLDLKAAQLSRQGFWNPLAGRGAAKMMIAYFGGRIDQDSWVAAIKLDGQPLAIGYGFRNDKSWLVYQLAKLQGAHDALSPGTHLLMHIMREACAAGAETFDLSLGDESYKTDWCDLRTDLFTTIESYGALGNLQHATALWSAKARRAISARPKLYSFAKTVDRNLRTLSLRD